MRVLLLLLLVSLPTFAQQPVVTLRSTVTGNQEQPRVMTILPWQPPIAGEFEYAPSRSLAEDLFRPIDREEFIRELDYRAVLDSAQQTTESTGEN